MNCLNPRCKHCGYDSRHIDQQGKAACAVCDEGRPRAEEIAPGVSSECPRCHKRTRFMEGDEAQCWYCNEQCILLGLYSV